MKAMQFNEVLFDQIDKCTATLASKADEYADETDRLSNFKKAAVLDSKTVPQAVQGMATKHTVSIADMVASGRTYPIEVWEEKIGDALNYLFLLKAVVVEEHTKDLLK